MKKSVPARTVAAAVLALCAATLAHKAMADDFLDVLGPITLYTAFVSVCQVNHCCDPLIWCLVLR